MPDEIPAPIEKKSPQNPHERTTETFGVVYANDLAEKEIQNTEPRFPVGSIIVREKHLNENLEKPELVIAMIKRRKGFSKSTDNWEFLTLNSDASQLIKRETKSDCAKCHIQARQTDWVFRDYLKKPNIR
jgi:hypothetical protein